MRTLLTTSNPKTAKGEGLGYLTAVLHLAPHNASGRNVCPFASAGCIAACLNTAGRGGISVDGATMENGLPDNAIQRARIERTRLFFENRRAFVYALMEEIERHVEKAEENGLKPAVRLNATSDIRFELVAPQVFARFPNVVFYDYTKDAQRMHRYLDPSDPWPSNYDLTFSRSETNEWDCIQILGAGGRVAVVFDTPKGAELPAGYAPSGRAFLVIDADAHDLRFTEPEGVVCGLRAKGRARTDTSGFVVRCERGF